MKKCPHDLMQCNCTKAEDCPESRLQPKLVVKYSCPVCGTECHNEFNADECVPTTLHNRKHVLLGGNSSWERQRRIERLASGGHPPIEFCANRTVHRV